MHGAKQGRADNAFKLPAFECAGRLVWLVSLLLDQIVLAGNLNVVNTNGAHKSALQVSLEVIFNSILDALPCSLV